MSAPDEEFRGELRSWLAGAPAARGSRSRRRPKTRQTLREWQRTLHAGRLGRHPLAGRVRRARRVADAGRDLQRGARPRRRAAAPRAGGRHPRRADVDGARHRGNSVRAGCRGSSAPTTSGASCSASPARAATSRASRRAPRRAAASTASSGQKVWSSYATFADMGIALGAHRSGRAAAQGDLDARDPDGRQGRRRAAAAPDDRRAASSTRSSSTTSRCRSRTSIGPENEGWRVANTTLANERGASFIWKEQVLHEVAIDAARRRRAAPRLHRRPARAPAARAVVDRRRDLPPAQRAHARPARARRGDRRGVEHREAVLGRRSASGSTRRRPTCSGRVRCSRRRRARDRRRSVGARPAGDARQLDHGRHERDPAQHHRRTHPRAAAGAARPR